MRVLRIPRVLAVAAAAGAAVAAALPGCVERKMFVRSDPPGARILLDGEPVAGPTPAEVPFDWGGTRHVTLIAPGHRVLEATAEVREPWFTYFPLDVAAEFLWPFTLEDHQTFEYRLEAYHPSEETFTAEQLAELKTRLEALKLRADEYRAGGSEGPGGAVRPPPAGGGEATPK